MDFHHYHHHPLSKQISPSFSSVACSDDVIDVQSRHVIQRLFDVGFLFLSSMRSASGHCKVPRMFTKSGATYAVADELLSASLDDGDSV